MKKRILVLALVFVLLFVLVIGTSCNKNIFDGWNVVFRYVLLIEGDNVYLHKIKSWNDSESESFTFTCEWCGNYFWASSNNATLYKDEPIHLDENMYHKCNG